MSYNFTISETSIEKKSKLSGLMVCPHSEARERLIQKEGVKVNLFRSSSALPDNWDEVLPSHKLFLKKAYLQALELNAPEGMRFAYLMFCKNGKTVGVANCQVLHFNAEKSINNPKKEQKSIFSSISRSMRSLVARNVDFNSLICGNLLLTGEHGFHFNEELIDKKEAVTALTNGLEKTREIFQKEGVPISITLVKEYFESSRSFIKPVLEQHGYHEFSIQPNMVFELSSLWLSFDDYLASMSSKYRVRTKRALKKGKAIIRKELNIQDIIKHQDRIFELYKTVVDNSGFNTFVLNPTYFLGLKRHLGDAFTLTAYYVEEEMIAFYTTIDSGEDLEAHFLGYDPAQNRKHQVYHNILLDIVKKGIEVRTKEITFARTALEIKSSIGAVPHEMHNYIKHRNSLPNKFIKKLFDYLNTPEEWTPRRPFKS